MKSKTPSKSAAPVAPGELFGSVAALHLEGKSEEALARIEQALAAGGEQQPEVYAAAGYLQYERKQFAQAVAAYRKLVDLDPANATGWFNLATALQALGTWEEAAAAFEKTLGADGNRYEAHLGLGLCRLQLGAARTTLEAYERCLRLVPNLEPAKLEPVLFGKAVAQQLLKNFPEAAELYGRVLKGNPRFEEALANLIGVQLELKDYAAAASCAEQLFKIRPDSRVAHEGLATAAFAVQDYEKASAHCAALVKVAPDAFEGWFNLGVALERPAGPKPPKPTRKPCGCVPTTPRCT